MRVRVTVRTRRLFQRRFCWPTRIWIGGSAEADDAVDFASTEGTAKTIAPSIAENIKNFFIVFLLN